MQQQVTDTPCEKELKRNQDVNSKADSSNGSTVCTGPRPTAPSAPHPCTVCPRTLTHTDTPTSTHLGGLPGTGTSTS